MVAGRADELPDLGQCRRQRADRRSIQRKGSR
jgi:hypothetical protein